MLNRNDVLQMKGIWLIVFVDAAIFAASACALPSEFSLRGTDQDFLERIRRAFACRIATRLPAVTYRSYSNLSEEVRSPSLHFLANSSTRACVLASALSLISSLAASAFRLRLTGSKRRSSSAADPLRLFIRAIIPAVQSHMRKSAPGTGPRTCQLRLHGGADARRVHLR